MLKMKDQCEKCHAKTALTDIAFICSFECTFCEACAQKMACICPNCNGELVRRPSRLKSPIAVAASQVSKKLFGSK
jgi:hypothetical protein